jgi:hypothetical protein
MIQVIVFTKNSLIHLSPPRPAMLSFVLALIFLVKILGVIVKPAPIIIAGSLLKVVPWGTPENPEDLKLVSIRALVTTL